MVGDKPGFLKQKNRLTVAMSRAKYSTNIVMMKKELGGKNNRALKSFSDAFQALRTLVHVNDESEAYQLSDSEFFTEGMMDAKGKVDIGNESHTFKIDVVFLCWVMNSFESRDQQVSLIRMIRRQINWIDGGVETMANGEPTHTISSLTNHSRNASWCASSAPDAMDTSPIAAPAPAAPHYSPPSCDPVVFKAGRSDLRSAYFMLSLESQDCLVSPIHLCCGVVLLEDLIKTTIQRGGISSETSTTVFKTGTTYRKIWGKIWAVYMLVLEKVGCWPGTYIGSGTPST
jgi:hypothetical protein